MQRKAFAESHEENQSFEHWCSERSVSCPQFKYWSLTMELELTILVFLRSLRQSDFELYVDSLQALIPWFFALDRTHYSRWLTVHLNDMKSLKSINPLVAGMFEEGKFTIKKSNRLFSAIARRYIDA